MSQEEMLTITVISLCLAISANGNPVYQNPYVSLNITPPNCTARTKDGSLCKFPFTYYGTTYYNCTGDGTSYPYDPDYLWCATKVSPLLGYREHGWCKHIECDSGNSITTNATLPDNSSMSSSGSDLVKISVKRFPYSRKMMEDDTTVSAKNNVTVVVSARKRTLPLAANGETIWPGNFLTALKLFCSSWKY